MEHWSQRPQEEAYLFNPAFCCNLITSSIVSYMEYDNRGMPFPLSFLILPITLHKFTRDSLPTLHTSLTSWMLENSNSRVLFPERVISFKPFTKEALLFGFCHKWMELKDYKNLMSDKKSKINKSIKELDGSAKECVETSRFLGKWFAKVGSAQTVMTLWGVKP